MAQPPVGAQAQLVALQSKYTNDHPDVIKAKNDIAVLKQKIADSDQQRKSVAAIEKSATRCPLERINSMASNR